MSDLIVLSSDRFLDPSVAVVVVVLRGVLTATIELR
jgi:hypothetical protein